MSKLNRKNCVVGLSFWGERLPHTYFNVRRTAQI